MSFMAAELAHDFTGVYYLRNGQLAAVVKGEEDGAAWVGVIENTMERCCWDSEGNHPLDSGLDLVERLSGTWRRAQ